MTPRQLGTSPPWGSGRIEGRGSWPHSHALVFDFEERCFQSGHWKGKAHTLVCVCSSAGPALYTQGTLREGRPCQSPRASQSWNAHCPECAFPFARGEAPTRISSSLHPGRKSFAIGGRGCRVPRILGVASLLRVDSVGCQPTIRNLAGWEKPSPCQFLLKASAPSLTFTPGVSES